MPSSNSGYLNSLRLEAMPLTLRWLREKLTPMTFDAIAVRGTSGLVAGSIIAFDLGKVLCVIRKVSEKSHAGGKVVEVLGELPDTFTYVIVDDLIGGGGTGRAIQEAMKNEGGTWLGSYYYHSKITKLP